MSANSNYNKKFLQENHIIDESNKDVTCRYAIGNVMQNIELFPKSIYKGGFKSIKFKGIIEKNTRERVSIPAQENDL